jgi:hypothetical protein
MRIHVLRKLLVAVTAVGLTVAAGAVATAGASGGPNSRHSRVAVPQTHDASTPSSYGVDIQAVYDAAGNPPWERTSVLTEG